MVCERSAVQETLQLDAFMKAKNQDLSEEKICFHIVEVDKHIFQTLSKTRCDVGSRKMIDDSHKAHEDTIGERRKQKLDFT